jgi:hypothetical protein
MRDKMMDRSLVMSEVKIRKTEYEGWKNCVRISNKVAELIVTTDVGPRIIYYGFIDGPNHMKIIKDQAGRCESQEWMIYGGHRLWHSPEDIERTYDKDNYPCEWSRVRHGIRIKSAMDQWTQVEKEMEITLDPLSSKVTIDHRLTNRNAWDIELSVWCLTVMAPGGREIIPQNEGGSNYAPNRSIALWPYTRLSDPRITWLDRYLFLDQDDQAETNFKIGLPVQAGWAAYCNLGQLFLKRFTHIQEAQYPDYGYCSYETYTGKEFLEMESLSPLWCVSPSETIEHTEEWELFDGIEKPSTEEETDQTILPLAIDSWTSQVPETKLN